MDVREWVDELNNECRRGRELRQLGSDVWTRDLSPEEEEILVAAANVGELSLSIDESSQMPVVRIASQLIFPQTDAYTVSKQWYSLKSLASRGVLRHSTNGTFALDAAALLKGAHLRALRILNGN